MVLKKSISFLLIVMSWFVVSQIIQAHAESIDETAVKVIEPKKNYQGFYSIDPETFDYLYTFKQTDSKHFANFIDGLIEHDAYGNLVGAVASHWESNEDATIWTFKLKEGIKWYTDEGSVYDEVRAHDFVAGLWHAADFQSQTLYLVKDVIKNLEAYVNGEVTFDEVGVKAIDDYTLQYELNSPTPYFPSMTTYSILLPVNQSFLESKGSGCRLGSPDLSNCSFGNLNPESILYNGAYRLTNFTSKSVIEYTANVDYWDAESVYIPKVKLIYSESLDPTSLFLAFERGEITSAPIDVYNAAIYAFAKKKYGDSIFVTETSSATSFACFVFNRQAYHSPLDPRIDISPKTAKQREDTKLAISNQAFRQAILHGLDVSAVNAQSVGEELKEISVRNLITQPDFVQTSYHQTYGELVGDSLKRLNPMLYPENFTVEDGQMSYFNPGLAKELMQVAKAELMEQGVDFPVYLDVLINGESEMSFRSAQALKNSLETELKGDVVINLITTSREHLAATKSASLVNTDLYFATAWSPDYGDPKSYMDILDPKQGDMLKYFGLNQAVIETEEDRQIKEQIGLNKFGYLKQAASDVVNDPDLRYELYAQAEAFAIDQAYFIPLSTSGGSYAVSKIIPYTKPYSSYGLSTMKFKGMQISDHIITVVERNQYKEQWIQKRNQIAPSINVDKILP